MKPGWTGRKPRTLAAIAGLLLLAGTSVPVLTQSSRVPGVPAFLQAGHCYRLSFPITGAPNWKILDVLDAGWIKAEVDAGPASARREPSWVNTAQIVTAREVRCSE